MKFSECGPALSGPLSLDFRYLINTIWPPLPIPAS